MDPLIFNVFLCDLSPSKSNIDLVSYADYNTPFAMGGSSEWEIINESKSVEESLTLWLPNNCMKVNPDEFHLRLSDKKVIRWIFVMRSFQVRAVKSFGGIKIDNKLTFEEHVVGLYKTPVKTSVLWQEFHL